MLGVGTDNYRSVKKYDGLIVLDVCNKYNLQTYIHFCRNIQNAQRTFHTATSTIEQNFQRATVT